VLCPRDRVQLDGRGGQEEAVPAEPQPEWLWLPQYAWTGWCGGGPQQKNGARCVLLHFI